MTEKKHAQHFAFIDVETTGLDPDLDSIVEVGCVITDFSLKQVAARFHQIARTFKSCWRDEVAEGFHRSSGLYDASCRDSQGFSIGSTVTEPAAVNLLSEYIQGHAPDGVIHVGLNPQFDFDFLKSASAGTVGENLCFKRIDVLALRRTVRSCIGEHALPPIPKATHRAMDDIRHCMDEFRYYISLLKDGFKSPSFLDKGFTI